MVRQTKSRRYGRGTGELVLAIESLAPAIAALAKMAPAQVAPTPPRLYAGQGVVAPPRFAGRSVRVAETIGHRRSLGGPKPLLVLDHVASDAFDLRALLALSGAWNRRFAQKNG
jgi:hypothetical protein